MPEEALQTAVKREAKGKGEKERYTHHRVPKNSKERESPPRDQCREIGENNRMEVNRDLFKKMRDSKGIFHPKMGSIKDRNSMDLKKQKILRRGGKNTQKNYTKKDLHDSDNHYGVITHLEPDILECEVKWALGSITMNKASGGDVFQLSYFKS